MKKAFTLAEVLIVLGLLGIIFEVTLPNLVKTYQKQVQVTQLKKFYSVFQTGMKTYMANLGCNDVRCTGLFSGWYFDASWQTNVNSAMREIFNIDNSCLHAAGGCSKTTKYLDVTYGSNTQFNSGYSFRTTDGFLFNIQDSNSSNCENNAATTTRSKLKNSCAMIIVDVNGNKKPDVWGRDIFAFYLGIDGNLYPNYGVDYAKAVCDSEDYSTCAFYWKRRSPDFCGNDGSTDITNAIGGGCSARIIEDSWEMNY